jgi:hydroxymethylpyrimidine pyrophosphatase-like HAD family hydrolase
LYYQALATDYDGTLATDGAVFEPTLQALEALRRSGRKLLMVTGRELEDLKSVFAHLALFDLVVAENGALLYRPKSREETLLAEPPPILFRQRLEGLGVRPLSCGRIIVATVEPHETEVLATIRELGLELQIIFNKGAVMVLPSGVNKATGLKAACKELGLSPHNVVGVGDAENDFAFLDLCGCSAAVANALPMLKQAADLTTDGARGDGVAELAQRLIKSDLAELTLARQQTIIGRRQDGSDLLLRPRENLLLVGSSGAGKAVLADRIASALAARRFQICIIDPEGDHARRKDALVLDSDGQKLPDLPKALPLSDGLLVLNLAAMAPAERGQAMREALLALLGLRDRLGRPHWILIEKAHLALPTELAPQATLAEAGGLFLVSVHPERIAPWILKGIDLALGVGDAPAEALADFAAAAGRALPPAAASDALASGRALAWQRSGERGLERVALTEPPRRSDAA